MKCGNPPWSVIKNVAHRFPDGSLHLFILFNLAIAQPLFDLLARSAPFFVAERSQPLDIILLVLLLTILMPSLFVVLEVMAGLLSQRLRNGLHTLFVAALLTVIALPAFKRVDDVPGIAVMAGAGLMGILGAAAYLRLDPVRQFLTFASIGLVVIPANFLLDSDISKIVFPNENSEEAVISVNSTIPVVMVVFDELPVTSLMDENRQIDRIRYPNFANLADDAYWFRNATTVADMSYLAIPAILTGRIPNELGSPTLKDHPNNLFTLLGNSYEMRVFEGYTNLCPPKLCSDSARAPALADRMLSMLVDVELIYLHIVLPVEMTTRLPPIDSSWHDFIEPTWKEDQQSSDRAQGKPHYTSFSRFVARFVDSIEYSDDPRLYFIHIRLPHVPWKYLPNGKSIIPGDIRDADGPINGLIGGGMSGRWDSDDWLIAQEFQRHLLQLGFADKLLGDAIGRLETVGLYERSLVIVAGDHGASFRAGEFRRRLSSNNLPDILPVPVIVKLPHQDRGVVSDRNVQTVDILPTIAEVLDVALPWSVDGRSLFDTSIPDRTELTVFDRKAGRLIVAPVGVDMYETLDRKLRIFGSGERVDGLYRIGRYSRLVGQEAGNYPIDYAPDVRVWLDGGDLWQDVDLESEFVPARITGQVDTNTDARENLNLAVAINGTIQAVTRTFVRGQDIWFSAIVPERSFRNGYNSVELFVVSGPTDRPRLLAPANVRPGMSNYSLTRLHGRESIETPEGRIVPIVPGAMGGNVDRGIQQGDVGIIRGWAADLRGWQPAESILVLLNGEVVHLVQPNRTRPDVAAHYGKPDLARSGFVLMFVSEALGDSANAEVRVIVLSSHGVASELTYGEEYAWGNRPKHTQPAPVQLSDFESSPEYALSMDGGSINIVSSSGQIIPIVSDTVAGYVDLWSTDGQFVFISGWAADVRRSQQVKLVLLFVNGQSVSARETNFARPDVARESGIESLMTSGFDFAVPSELLGALDNTEVRLFAITKDEEAQELAYSPGYPWPRRSEDSIQ